MEILFRGATDVDIKAVANWLITTQFRNDALAFCEPETVGFYCNWDIIRRDYRDGLVEVAVIGGETVAFVTGEANKIEIMEVHPCHRGRGIGTAFARHRLNRAATNGATALSVECAPLTSLTFWQSMGFKQIDSNRSAFVRIAL